MAGLLFSLENQKKIQMLKTVFARDQLTLATLDCPKELLNDDPARELFSKILRLRVTGYGAEYPAHVIACDVSDFYSTHIAVCKKTRSGLEPLMSYKMISLSRSREFHQSFPLQQIAKEAAAEPHLTAITNILRRATENQKDVGYCCSWTIHPDTRRDRELVQVLRDSVYLSHGMWQRDENVPEMLIAGVERFKTPAYQESIGYERIRAGAALLGPLPHPALNHESIVLLHLLQVSERVRDFTAALTPFWEQRSAFSARALRSEKKAA